MGTTYQRPDSDVDIAVLSPYNNQPSSDQCIALQQQRALMRQRDIDLIHLRSTNTMLQFEIIAHGRRIATPARFESDLFAVLVDAFYQNSLTNAPKLSLQDCKMASRYCATTVSKPPLMAAMMVGWATLSCAIVTILVGISTVTVVTPAISLTSLVMARTQ
jgi:hypothetical protein